MEPLIFVCSPFRGRGETEPERAAAQAANVEAARGYARLVVRAGGRPVVPHLLYPQFLDDADPLERAAGLRLARRDLLLCSELWLWDPPSEGMTGEILLALEVGIPVTFMGAAFDWLHAHELPGRIRLAEHVRFPGEVAITPVARQALALAGVIA